MRKIVFLLTVMMIIEFAQLFSIYQPKDVKSSADIYEDVMRVLEAGIMSLDEEGYFNGSLFVTRYELARSFSSLLKSVPLEKMKDTMRKAEEIDKILKRLDDVEKRLSEISLEDIFNRIEKTKIEMTAQLEKLKASLDMVKGYNTFVDAVKGSLRVQDEKIENMRIRISNNEKNLHALVDQLNNVSNELSKISTKIDPMERRIEKIMANIERQNELYEKTRKLEDRLDDMDVKVQEAISASKGAVAKVKDISEFSVKLKKLEDDYTKLKSVVIVTNDSISNIASDLEKVKKESSDLQGEVEKLKVEIANLRNNIWYAMGAGIVGASIGLLALIMLWQR